ncbi:MAG: HAMP domain-containing sensor histidine kinase [Trueperaceae bacterium]|nr:HAMP domain-containing sensor histidine kinase [Trueperaceae bacterium]
MDAPEVSSAPYVLLATDGERRGSGLQRVTDDLGYASEVFTDVEALLYHTRGAVPEALVIEQALLERVPQLDVLSLLRRRKELTEVPLLVLGADDPERHARAVAAGADVYLALPTRPAVVRAHLSRLLDRRQRDRQLRAALERARAFEHAYKDSERVKDDLTHMLVHDLKSPISSVMGLLDHSIEMLSSGEGDASVSELLTLARNESQHLLSLAANILDVRRMKEGHMPYQPEEVASLTKLAKEALGDVSGGPRERNFGFLVRPEAESLHADPKLLRRVMANLMANAIKHTRRGGYIDFRAWKQDDAFVLSVRDDGEGIPEADQKRIFNAFEQSRHTIHDRFDTGMGLTFCKLAVEKHGGSIWVESRSGKGSTFFFTIPVDVAARAGDDPVAVA